MASSLRPSKVTQISSSVTLLDRDHSILSFNERVLDWAYRKEVPLLERLRYLCIVSSNMDEFFEVREVRDPVKPADVVQTKINHLNSMELSFDKAKRFALTKVILKQISFRGDLPHSLTGILLRLLLFYLILLFNCFQLGSLALI